MSKNILCLKLHTWSEDHYHQCSVNSTHPVTFRPFSLTRSVLPECCRPSHSKWNSASDVHCPLLPACGNSQYEFSTHCPSRSPEEWTLLLPPTHTPQPQRHACLCCVTSVQSGALNKSAETLTGWESSMGPNQHRSWNRPVSFSNTDFT